MENKNLINGEKLEFGNKKQIQYIKNSSKILKSIDDYEEVEASEVTCTTSTYVDAHFDCLNEECKKRVSYSTEIEGADEYEALDDIEGDKIDCSYCGAQYEIKGNGNIIYKKPIEQEEDEDIKEVFNPNQLKINIE